MSAARSSQSVVVDAVAGLVGVVLASAPLQGIPPTIFSEMSALAVRTGSLNLGQGFPDVDGPPEVIAEAVAALESGHNQYAPGIGVPALRQAIARHQQRHYGLDLDPDRQVVVTTGCTEGVAAALLGLVDPGDEVVVLEPYYDSYVAMIQMAGGVRRPVTLRAPDFRLDLDELRAAVTPKTRFMLLNSPHNPTGTVLTAEELDAIAAVAIEHDLVVITDEVYEHLTYDGREHRAAGHAAGDVRAHAHPVERGQVLLVHRLEGRLGHRSRRAGRRGAGGQAVADVHLRLAAAAGRGPGPRRARRLPDRARQGPPGAPRPAVRRAARRPGSTAFTPEGTYFAMTDVSGLGWDDGMAFCRALPERAGVVAIPAQVFYDDPAAPGAGRHLVRWAFCKERSVIAECASRLAAADLGA